MSSEDGKETKVQAALRQEESPAESEFERIFQDHHYHMIQAAYRVTGSAADAEDILQTVFLRMLRRRELPNLSQNLGSYLHRAAVNASIDLLRSRKGHKDVPLDTVAPLARSREAGPDDRQIASEVEEWLRKAVARMSPQTAEIFALRYFEGYSNQEIADAVKTSPGVVAVVLHRARNRLRDELGSH